MVNINEECLCECGCGLPVKIRNGKPNRFVHGHNRTVIENHKVRVANVCKRKGWLYEICIGHPYADINNRVEQHRLIMEKYLERYLEPEEDVHHCNEEKGRQ